MKTTALLLLITLFSGCTTEDRAIDVNRAAGGSRRATARAGGIKVQNPSTVVLDSGVRIKDLVIGKGREARRGSVVLVHYTGTLKDGKVFDKTDRSGKPTRLILNTGPGGVIPGFAQGIQGMREGGVREIWIPWQLGYGPTPQSGIPARSNLTFKVELMEVL